MKIRAGLVVFIAVVQAILFLTHLILYETWTVSIPANGGTGALWLKIVLGLLSVSFLVASLLAWRYTGAAVQTIYKVAAVWLGLLSFLFFAAVLSWITLGVTWAAGLHANFHLMVEVLFAAAAAAGVYGVFNASWTRITRTTVRLANLPETWRGRKAALISDLHLGHVRNGSFLRRIVAEVLNEKPDAVFIAGDLYDGTGIDAKRAAEPLSRLTAPHGVYFVAGNHEQFGDDSKYLHAVEAAGVRVLRNEKVEADGLQIIGVPYRHASRVAHFAAVLKGIGLDRRRASILLTHAPDHPQVAEQAGVSLQLSGHTHVGQFIPWSWMARRIYHQFVYGLSRIGKMQVFTSSGAGTWGPPLRLGSNPEIVILQFE
ncbi:MAG TPA: metallophosphoesterase [Candidatus Acidoferrum sp.]|jgi:predicted MPP superfamily phosphohydrolase|nr:metallophosphoesterase [Candidatus Acidoferrum sp.]